MYTEVLDWRTYLFNCNNVNWSRQLRIPVPHDCEMLHTISSLHIGQTIRELAAAAA